MRNFHLPGRSIIMTKIAATSHHLASTEGIDILKKGEML